MDSIQTFFLFIQDQILGMKWLNSLIKNLLTALNVDVDGRLGGSIQFFIYDVLKITILLCFLIIIKNSIFRNSLIFQGLPPIKYQNLMYFPLFLPL